MLGMPQNIIVRSGNTWIIMNERRSVVLVVIVDFETWRDAKTNDH